MNPKDIQAVRDRLQKLDQQHQQGQLQRKAYEKEKARLEREILQAVMGGGGAAAAAASGTAPVPTARPSRGLTAGVLSFVLVLAVAGYAFTGSPGVPGAGPPGSTAAADPHANAMDEAEFAAAVDKLAERLKGQPDDAEGWAMLARSYGMLGRLDDALAAYPKAVALNAQDARLLADYADTMALRNDRNLEGEPLKLVERALKLEPTNLKALSLAGAAAFNRKDFAGAVSYWEQVVQHAPPESPYLPQVQASIAEARERGQLGPGKAPAKAPTPAAAATPQPAPVAATAAAPTPTPVAAATAPGAKTDAAAAVATIRGTVRLAPALASRAAPTDTVFILARPAEGSRMPLAILRKQVKDLPAEFTLDDSMAMSPAAKMSLFPQVVVSARVSKSGQAAQAAGDLTGQSAPVSPTTTGLLIEINEVVRQ